MRRRGFEDEDDDENDNGRLIYPFPNRFTMTTPEMAIAPPRRESQVGSSRCYQAVQPPSTARIAPVVNFAASDAR
jgi:hypothetical protein